MNTTQEQVVETAAELELGDLSLAYCSDRAYVYHGDCLDMMRSLLMDGCAGTVDAVVCDPPYGLGFMGRAWDHPDNVAFRVQTWKLALQLLKPGGHLVAFGGSRTYHRLAMAVEDAGFEIRDQLLWVYGSGMPKSHNLHGAHEGWGTALKPCHEPAVLARKPLVGTVAANVLIHRTGALHIEACRVGEGTGGVRLVSYPDVRGGNIGQDKAAYADRAKVLRLVKDKGRWPANLLHDGSEDVLAAFPAASGQQAASRTDRVSKTGAVLGAMRDAAEVMPPRDDGEDRSAARFFYSAKASKQDRAGSRHPTVKPVALMQWLVRLVTPEDGVVLDPFAGSGTTLAAGLAEGFHVIGIERESEYVADTVRRMQSLEGGRSQTGLILPVPCEGEDEKTW